MSQFNQVIEKNLSSVQKPARYTGGEINISIKENPLVRLAISYPDLYEIGMSNNGIKILYDVANRFDEAACERVFAVAPDFEDVLKKNNEALYTLESYTPLFELDCIGFNLAHELLISNVLQILELGKIPLERSQRRETDPIIIGGGEAVSNPLPWSMFFDLAFIGDGEVGMPFIVEKLIKAKKEGLSRNETLELFKAEEGFFNPDSYSYEKNDEGFYCPSGPDVLKQSCKKLVDIDPLKPIVSNIRIAQERAVIEMTRGCKNLCKFCHAGYYELPYRKSDPQKVLSKVKEIIGNTGYDGLTLSSLSLSDYRELVQVLNELMPYCNENGISIALPSLKVDPATLPIIEMVSDVRKSSITLAVESASEAMRKKANKRVLTDELLTIVTYIHSKGWRHVKFYFMLGLPGCDETDEAEDIIELLKQVRLAAKGLNLNVTLSPFIPKPHTPFQWNEQKQADYFNEKVLQVKRGLPRSVKIKNHVVTSSMLEGFFSRGDHKAGEVALAAFNNGARLDSWREYHDYDIWENVLPEDWAKYLAKRQDDLPWDVIKTGREKIVQQHRVKDFDISRKSSTTYTEELQIDAAKRAFERFTDKYVVIAKARCSFSKTGLTRFIPHLDLIEILKRAFRMAAVPISFTQGFNKRERIAGAFPLPLGLESTSELIEIELYDKLDKNVIESVNEHLPKGIELININLIESKDSLMALIDATSYRVEWPNDFSAGILKANLDKKPDFVKRGKKKERVVSFDAAIMNYSIEGNFLSMMLRTGTEESIRIDEVLSVLLNRDNDLIKECRVIKNGQYHKGEELL
jgi:radical SAM family uncharacterized protein/radical SAM-linked protein